MQEFVLGNKNYSTDMKEMNGNAQIIEGVLQDEGAIGYVGVGYLFDENGPDPQGPQGPEDLQGAGRRRPSAHDKAAVDSGNYPIARPLYMATNGKPKGDAAEFLAWIVGPEGQADRRARGLLHGRRGKYKAANDKNFK